MDGLWWINPINMDDLGGKPTIFGNIHVGFTTPLAHWIVYASQIKQVLRHRQMHQMCYNQKVQVTSLQ